MKYLLRQASKEEQEWMWKNIFDPYLDEINEKNEISGQRMEYYEWQGIRHYEETMLSYSQNMLSYGHLKFDKTKTNGDGVNWIIQKSEIREFKKKHGIVKPRFSKSKLICRDNNNQ